MCSYCDVDDGHGIDECHKRLEDKFGSGTAELREGETTDENSHASATAETLANADDETLEEIGVDEDDDLRCDGGRDMSSSGTEQLLECSSISVWINLPRDMIPHPFVGIIGPCLCYVGNQSNAHRVSRIPGNEPSYGDRDYNHEQPITEGLHDCTEQPLVRCPSKIAGQRHGYWLTDALHLTICSYLFHRFIQRKFCRINRSVDTDTDHGDSLRCDGGQVENDTERSWDDLEYVTAEPPMIVRSAMGDLDSGRCAVSYYGAAGRCSGEAEYKTTIGFDGRKEYVPLCEEHAGRSVDTDTEDEDDQELVTDGGTLRNPDRPQWTPTPHDDGPRCRNCESHVLEQTARVFGDNQDRLFHCPHCLSVRDLKFGAGTDPDYDPAEDRGQTSDKHPIFPDTEGDGQ